MSIADEKLAGIAKLLKKGAIPPRESVRSFLSWFGAQRRGYYVTSRIRHSLAKHGLVTSPNFEWAYIDGSIAFELAPAADGEMADTTYDPTYRISSLASANKVPVSVNPNATLQQVTTIMLSNDFSQLPVMTTPRELKGIVSWKSIGSRLALNIPIETAKDCMEQAQVLSATEPLFSAISIVAARDCVLVEATDKTICGIVTASDLNDQFLLLAEPFLLVGEIENGVRRMLHGKFTKAELEAAKAPDEDDRQIEAPSDLTFGEYIRLIDNPERWKKLKVAVDRVTVVEQLNRVRSIRNDVMHFDPEGLDDEDLDFLRDFSRFLKGLRDVGVA